MKSKIVEWEGSETPPLIKIRNIASRASAAPALLHDHLRVGPCHNLAVVVQVQQRHRAEPGWHATGPVHEVRVYGVDDGLQHRVVRSVHVVVQRKLARAKAVESVVSVELTYIYSKSRLNLARL